MTIFIVYLVTNLINGMVYVGKTGQYLSSRRLAHCYASRRGSSAYFHRALRKYGEDNFTWEVLTECPTERQAFDCERYWIKAFKANNPQHGYNLSEGGEGPSGNIPSLETRNKMSLSHRGKKMSPSSIEKTRVAKFKPIICLETGTVYPSQLEAVRILGIDKMSLSGACRGKNHTAGGLHWAFYIEGMDTTPKSFPASVVSLETREKLSTHRCKKIKCVETNITYDSLQKAANAVGLRSSSSLTWACKHPSHTVAGFHWQYA